MNDLENTVGLCSITVEGNNISRSCPLLLGYIGIFVVRMHFAFLDDFLPGFWPVLMVWNLVTELEHYFHKTFRKLFLYNLLASDVEI